MSKRIRSLSATVLVSLAALGLDDCEGPPPPTYHRACTGRKLNVTYNNSDCADNCVNTTVECKWRLRGGGRDVEDDEIAPVGKSQAVTGANWTLTQEFTFKKSGDYEVVARCGQAAFEVCKYVTVWPVVAKKLSFSKHPKVNGHVVRAHTLMGEANTAMRDDDGAGDEGDTDDVNACIDWSADNDLPDFTVAWGDGFNDVDSSTKFRPPDIPLRNGLRGPREGVFRWMRIR
jgi:hypothetical protein